MKKILSVIAGMFPLAMIGGYYLYEYVQIRTVEQITEQNDKPYTVHFCSQFNKYIDVYNNKVDFINETLELYNQLVEDINNDNYASLGDKVENIKSRLHSISIFENVPLDEMTRKQAIYLSGLFKICSESNKKEIGADNLEAEDFMLELADYFTALDSLSNLADYFNSLADALKEIDDLDEELEDLE